jgi:hypothetical protein
MPYVPAGQDTHRLPFTPTCSEYVPIRQAWHRKGVKLLFRMYPLRHWHWSSDDPIGESENGGQPWHVDAWYTLKLSAGHWSHTVAPPFAYVPAWHHRHCAYADAPAAGL